MAQEWRKVVLQHLPAPLSKIELGKTSLDEVEKLLGKSALTEGDKSYWEYEGFKYSLQVNFKNKIVESFHYTFSKSKPDLQLVKKYIDTKKLKAFPPTGASAGKFLKDETSKGSLVIDPVNKTIYSVELK